ncbi:MAG: P1 family peptidase [Synergistaceae bacterium]|jgi:L-aminopeptidase/D-esterase-like protein|nr:P1 family peptidase [Synergistaceae bacterium]
MTVIPVIQRLFLSTLLIFALAKSAFAEPGLQIVPLSSVPGIKIGHVTDVENGTGCSVMIVEDPKGAVCGVDVRGGSPGTRETDLLDPTKTVQKANAVVLSGGSAFGLAAADGVMTFLEEKKIGFDVGLTVVPIVPSAILFDLGLGSAFVRPDKAWGYKAAENAFAGLPWKDGNTGAGTGATVGKGTASIGGVPMKGGLGSCAFKFGDLVVGAMVAVNAAGNVVDPATGNIVAGAIGKDGVFIDLETWTMDTRYDPPKATENTTIGVIVTNASLNQAQAKKLAEMAQDGLARAIKPTHTASDGDTIFALSLGGVESKSMIWRNVEVNMNLLGVLAVNAMQTAIVNAVANAETLLDVKGAASFETAPQQPSKVFVR